MVVEAQVGGEHATRRQREPHLERLLPLQPPHRSHRRLCRVVLLQLLLLEEAVHFILEEVLLLLLHLMLRLALGQRQLCLQGADRRLEVLRGHERLCPGTPRCVQRRRLEAGELRHQLRGRSGVRLRGRRLQTRLLRRVRGGEERLEGRESAVVEAKQRSRVQRRGVFVARRRDMTENSRERVLERRGP